MFRIGIDVGGTNTDAALLDNNQVIASAKAQTSEDIISGVVQALREILSKSNVKPDDVSAVMLGTTHFLNAVVQRVGLNPVAVIRIGLPAAASLPPAIDWPESIRDVVCASRYMVAGGYEHDGRVIAPLDEERLESIADEIAEMDVASVAITSIFSPINAEMEERAREMLLERIPGLKITLSNTVGGMGLLAREAATILNASLVNLSTEITTSFKRALASLEITAPFFISQNDGTLMSVNAAEEFPVLTFASGPTNSMRGAGFLSNLDEAIVVDIGGTTTDVGVLANGFPRLAGASVDIGGIRTNFRMPDVYAVGLGGGSIVSLDTGLAIGPESVGYRLTEEALVFGGQTLTTSDIAVAAGKADMGESSRLNGLSSDTVSEAMALIREIIEDAVDRMKLQAIDVPVILVGGGSILAPTDLRGASQVLRPKHYEVANAIGAAIAKVSGECERVFSYSEIDRNAALQCAKEVASEAAVRSGADSETIQIVEIDEIPLAYMTGGATRVKVKAVGDVNGI